MKKIIFTLLLFCFPFGFVFASADAIPLESVGNIVKLNIVRMDRGEIKEYLDEISGVMISEKGYILTDYTDLIKEMETYPQLYGVTVCTNDQSMDSTDCSKEATIVQTDKRLGVALLQVSIIWQMNTDNLSYGKSFRVQYEGLTQEKFPFLYYAKNFGVPAQEGEKVYVLGYPEYWGGSQQVTPAIVLRTEKEYGVLDVALSKGIFGAAVYSDKDDRLIGMVVDVDLESEEEGARFIDAKALDTFLMNTYLPDIPIAGTLSLSCEKENTREKENGFCGCDFGYDWENVRGECSPFPASDYCGANAYRVGDYCECFEGFGWGMYPDSSVVQCILLSEISEDQLTEASGGLPTFLWRDLIFKPIYDIKVFAKKLRNEKALFLWKPVDGEKAKECFFDIWDEDENKQMVIFQRKNVALVKLSPEAKHRVEISGCMVDDTEKTAWSSFYIEK